MSILKLIQQGGISLIPLAFCSVLIVAVVLERIWTYSRIGNVPQELMRRIENLLAANQWHEAVRLLDGSMNPFARIAKASLMRKAASQQEIADTLTLACDAELAAATRPLPVLGTIGNIAPFIGLFGTVIGIMEAFHSVYQVKSAGADVVSGGIAEALIATAAGLAVGICAVVSNNWCSAWVDDYRLRLERFATEWSYRLHALQQETAELSDTTVIRASAPSLAAAEEPVV